MFNLRERLLTLESQYKDSRLAPSEITELVRKCVSDPHVKIQTRRNSKADLDQVIPHGEYDADLDDEQEPCIYLSLVYHPDQQHLQLNQTDWPRVAFEVVEVIGHEYVHRDQHRRRFRARGYPSTLEMDHPLRADQLYYGDTSEIEAYGFSIAAELAFFYDGDSSSAALTDTYQLYQRLFSADQSVILKLDKYILKYLNKLKAIKNAKTTTARRTKH